MDRWRQDLRVAFRSLIRHRTFSAFAVLTLALGIGATTAIFSVVYGILLRPLPYLEAERIVAFGQTARSAPAEPVDGSSSHVNFLDWQRRSKTIPVMAAYGGGLAVISHQGEAEVVRTGSVTPAFFDVFRASPVIGRAFTSEENLPTGPRAIVISFGFWQERFGGRPDVLSQTIEIGGAAWPIVGVAPRGFDFPARARVWMPVRNNDQQCGRGCVYLNGIGRLADGIGVSVAQQEMSSIAAALESEYPSANFDTTVMVQSLHERTVGSVQLALVVLLSAVGMVLLIACANVANLVLVRGTARQSEIAVRTALGAARRRLVSLLLTEHLLLATFGGIVGVLFAAWGVQALKGLAPDNLPRLDEVTFDMPTLLFSCLSVGVTAVLFGLGPSLQLAGVPLSHALGQRGAIGRSGARWTRSLLLIAEVGLSIVLLLGAGLLLRSVAALQTTEMGFDPQGISVFTISLPAARYPGEQAIAGHDRLDTELAALPGVTAVARVSGLPLGPSENVQSFTRTDQPPPPAGQGPSSLYRVVDADYFRTMHIPILRGRAFEPADRAGAPRVAIVSRRMAATFWPGEDPVGRSIRFANNDEATIVGVVENVRSQTLTSEAQPELYVPHAQTSVRTVMYVVKSVLPGAQVLTAARDVVRKIDPGLPLIYPSAMRDLVDDQLARPRFYLVLLGLFAVLAVVLAAVGIYGVTAYVVTARTREMGIRLALGASPSDVVRMMIVQGLRPTLTGVAVGIVGAVVMSQAAAGMLFHVKPSDPLTFASVPLIIAASGVLAAWLPARRACRIDPVTALKPE